MGNHIKDDDTANGTSLRSEINEAADETEVPRAVADAVLVSSVENEYYVRSSKTYETYYQNTYRFYVNR